MDTVKIHRDQEEYTHPHACNGSGLVLIELLVWDDDTQEEVPYIEGVPCRRCSEEREDRGFWHNG